MAMRDLCPKDRASFSGNVTEVIIPGPRQLYRLCGTYIKRRKETGAITKCKNCKHGIWWFDSMFFWNTLDAVTHFTEQQNEVNGLLRRLIREASAVSFDWNSFESIWVMNIPKAQSVEAYSGIAKEQLQFSAKDVQDKSGNEMLSGGLVQFVIYDVEEKYAGFLSKSPRPFLISKAGHA